MGGGALLSLRRGERRRFWSSNQRDGRPPPFPLLMKREGGERYAFPNKETTHDLSHDAAFDACSSRKARWIRSKIRRNPGRACPCPVLGLAQQRSAQCVAQAKGLLSVYWSRGTLVTRTCARAVAAPRGKACRVTATVLRGSIGDIQEQSIQAKETRPRQEELAGKTNQGISRPGERQASGRDKMTTAARRLPRQATTLYLRSSTSTNVSPWGLSRHVWREAVQPAVRGGMRR